MTRALGRDALSRRSTPAVAALLVAFVLAGCGATIDTASPPAASQSAATPAGSSAAASSDAPASSSNGPTDASQPTPAPGDSGSASPDASPSGGSTPAGECSGSDQNRAFFVDAAAALSWTVYCPVFPDGWFVETGSFRLGGGGTLRIAYKGPNGARLELREGAICGDPSACRPSGAESGTTAFGDREGTLIALEGGGYAVVVDAGAPVSWIAIGANLDEATFRGFAAAIHRVTP